MNEQTLRTAYLNGFKGMTKENFEIWIEEVTEDECPSKEQHCSALLKLTRRSSAQQWVVACLLESGHSGSHRMEQPMTWEGDDR